MYSKEQLITRLKLGTTLTTPELVLVVKSLMEEHSKLEDKVKLLESKYNELSKNRRRADTNSGETIQTTSIQSQPKQR